MSGRSTHRAAPSRRGVRTRHVVVPLVLVLVFAFIAGGTWVALSRYGDTLRTGTCTASGLGTSHRYSAEQTANAALISAVALDRGMPPRAASIALATAFQESRLENIDHGDRDSIGLFQQRPSQGWGTVDQIMDPVYASNAFYDALAKVPGYETMSLNDAAQTVQRSGFPEAYADHETEGRIFASALTGRSGANLVCDLDAPSGAGDPRTAQASLAREFPRLSAAGTVTSALSPAAGSAPAVPSGAGATALVIDPHGDEGRGWALASWAVARAEQDGIVQVSYGGRVWGRTGTENTTPGSWTTQAGGDASKVVVLVAGS
ncbi:hypothetical protein ACT3TZ_09815 [Brachybacterium sp. AOP25-B2-12]|uniref:hypothetical protein n=1 Tax=Brachybacterium sp. AOP25-B2-12 TaxID=3457710 RepID=UPI0040336F12